VTSAPYTVFHRGAALERLRQDEFDVLVVGGGITGAGVLLDAASRGLTAALVERDDFASGTSSKSSKLVHGGLRYLQQREFALVRENLAERRRLLHNAPHLVEPLEFLIPLFGTGGVVDRTVVWAYSAALWLYDLAGGWRIGHSHRKLTADEVAAHLPTLRRDRLVAGFSYFDARTDDARLTLAVIRTAVLGHGAVACNHARVTALVREGARVTGAVVQAEDEAEPVTVRARTVVNATGVWADELRSLDREDDTPQLRPAKGVHLTVSRDALPCDVAAVIPVPKDRRSIFVVPWGAHTYLGTTDTDYTGPLDDPPVLGEDVAYVLAAANTAFERSLRPEDVTGSWAGLRPLLAHSPGRRGPPSARTADLSRRHQVTVSPDGFVTITGGKLTTYRKMAEDAVDALRPWLGNLRTSPTKRLRLRGAEEPALSRSRSARAPAGLDDSAIAHLAGRYGSETAAVLGLVNDDPSLARPLSTALPYLGAEALYAARYEMATTLDDVLSRRTRALLLDARASLEAALPVADLLARELGWDGGRKQAELARYVGLATRDRLADAESATGGPA
jgi:glycerol-3-phosphate dehydrogenase